MTNPFAAHGITHLSASTLNTFAASPAMFVIEKILKRRQPVGASAHRGTATEAGVAAFLLQEKSVSDAQEIALKEFDRLTALSGDPRRATERDGIPGLVANGIGALRDYGRPTAAQGKIEHWFEGVAVPLIGYYDFKWDDHGILVDLKSQLKLASEINVAHARQIALYKTAFSDNFDARIAYVTPKKHAVYALENSRAHLESLRRIAMACQAFCAVSSNPYDLVAITAPDVTSFYYSDPVARATAYEVYGI